jgi:hypothetical protein
MRQRAIQITGGLFVVVLVVLMFGGSIFGGWAIYDDCRGSGGGWFACLYEALSRK